MTDDKQPVQSISSKVETSKPVVPTPTSDHVSITSDVKSADNLFLDKKDNKSNLSTGMPSVNKSKNDENTEIQGMPKEFRDYHPITGGHSRTAGLLIMIISFVFLIAVSIGVYLYIFKPYLLEQNINSKSKTKESTILNEIKIDKEVDLDKNLDLNDSSVDSPRQVYDKYILAVSEADNFSIYYNAINIYGSQQKIEQVEADKLRFEAPNSQDKVKEFLIKEVPSLLGNEKITEQILGQQATILISSADDEFLGSIEMIKENEEWKINNISWKKNNDKKIDTTEQTEVQYIKAEDRDNDGLTDLEENLLDTNKESSDSDNDGYSDASEVINLYNPAGSDKLIDSPRLASYLNEIFDYSIIYPSQWSKEVRDNRESVIFRSDDDSIIQVLSILNPQKLTIDEWYKQSFNLDNIDSDLIVNTKNWKGIKTQNGLYIYIQGFDANEIFVLQYVPVGVTLDYTNIFQAMINSFVIK